MKHTRLEIAKILADIAPPGEKQAEKIEAIRQLNLRNMQAIDLADVLEQYDEF